MSTAFHVRAKFRVLEVKQRLEAVRVELKPVIAKGPNYPGGSEENARFWEATPAGEAGFWRKPDDPPMPLGSYWYVDIVEDPAGPYILASVNCKMGSREVWLSEHRGDVKFDIHNCAAWPAFDLDRIGQKYRVVLTQADAPEPGAATYP